MVAEGDCVAIFNSIHRVMQAERILLDRGLAIQLIPVPRQLSAECGMAIAFPDHLLDQVQGELAGHGIRIAEVWIKGRSGYEPMP